MIAGKVAKHYADLKHVRESFLKLAVVTPGQVQIPPAAQV